jgi:hypothetical protein
VRLWLYVAYWKSQASSIFDESYYCGDIGAAIALTALHVEHLKAPDRLGGVCTALQPEMDDEGGREDGSI